MLNLRAVAWVVSVLLVGCGGRARSGPDEAVAGSGGGATTTPSGTGSSATETTEAAPFLLDDALPWFDASGAIKLPLEAGNTVLYAQTMGNPAHATLSTHLPSDLLRNATEVSFATRASRHARVLLSVGHQVRGYDYFARNSSEVWPLAAVEVTDQWQTQSISVAELMPPETPEDAAAGWFFIAFIIDDPDPLELWLDRVHLK